MSTNETDILSISKVQLDEHFIGITGDERADYHYRSDSPTIEQAMQFQEILAEQRWPTMEDAEEELNELVAALETQAMEDGILGQVVTLSGETLQLPEARLDPSRREVMQSILEVDPSEPDERLITGARGKLGGFHYVMTECDDGTGIKAHLVYQVGQGSINTPNGQLLLLASATVGHSTSLEFAEDRQNSDIRDAYSLFDDTDESIAFCAQKLYDLTANRDHDYTAEELRLVGQYVMALTTFDKLQDKHQQVLDAVETILSYFLINAVGHKRRSIAHTAGYYQYYTRPDFSQSSEPRPYKLDADEEPIVTEPLHITELTIMPSLRRVKINGAKPTIIPYEPHLIVRNGVETRYVALSGIMDITL